MVAAPPVFFANSYMPANGWHNRLPEWIRGGDAYRDMRAPVRHALQTIADACNPADDDGNLTGAFGGAVHFAEMIGCGRATFWRYVAQFERHGFIVLLGHGGPHAFRNASNCWAIPGVLGGLDERKARRTTQQMVKAPDGVLRPQILQVGDQATLWPLEDVPVKCARRRRKKSSGGEGVVSKRDYPSLKMRLPSSQNETVPSMVSMVSKKTMVLLQSGPGKSGHALPHHTVDDLRDTTRLLGLLQRAIEVGVMTASDEDRLRFVAAAERALRLADDPPALFAHTVNAGHWDRVATIDQHKAHERLKRHLWGEGHDERTA